MWREVASSTHECEEQGRRCLDHQMHVTCLKLSQNTFGILIQASREEKKTKSEKQNKTKQRN